MQTRQSQRLATIERKAKLIQALIAKTQGKLQKQELEAIANHRWQIEFQNRSGLAEDHDLIDRQLTIVVHEDVKEFATAATLINRGVEHSWAGECYDRTFGNWIVGDGQFGYSEHLEYSNNGEFGPPTIEEFSPEFDLDNTQAIVLKFVEHDSLNNRDWHEETWFLHILISGHDFSIDPVVAEIMERFSL